MDEMFAGFAKLFVVVTFLALKDLAEMTIIM